RKKPRLVSATSLRVKNTVSGALRVPDSNVVITGYPRNDVFFAQKREKTPLEAGLLLRDRKDRRLGIYMPTHRREGRLDVLSLFFGEMDSINSRLREQRVILLVKVHYYHLEEMQKNPSEYSNIYFIQDKDVEQDIYSLLPAVDFLVTDYSSVYFDYLLLDRPIIFAPFDMEEYLRDDRELYYGYNDVTPGPKAGNWDEVLKYIGESLSFPERYARERDRVREMFHTYCDGHSSERVYKEILGILQAKPLGAARKR
ncbi:MAG: CDP-glycerol glycerophosphotransferase family protein, partial [Candidatus Omnitrophica bacterium]|nr:CDP-glycerol glycerophosphotransferase family protein [Candidatus Omnitrophota bacterium]